MFKLLEEMIEDFVQEKEVRICSECKKIMVEGYCIEGGVEYYCSDKCLEANMTRNDFIDLYCNGDDDSYYTEWDYDEEGYELLKEIIKKAPGLKYKI